MSLTDEYFRLSGEYAHKYGTRTILLMQVGSFFECYSKTDSVGNITDANMKEFCSACDLNCSITNGRCMAGFPFSCNFRDYSLERYVKKMQELGYTIIVYVQDGQGSNTTRSLHCIYSPGTFFSNDSDSVVCCLSNNTCCFWIERVNIGSIGSKIIIGMSNIDIYTGRTTCFEYESEINARHNQTTYDELERFISSFQPNEVIIISNLSANDIQDIINFANIRACANPIHLVDMQSAPQSHPFYIQAKNCQKQTYRKEMLGKFFSFHICNSIFQSYSAYEFAIQSFTFLLHFIHEHNPHLTHKIIEPEFENKSDRMVLANHTLEQLNIIDAFDSGSKMTSGKYSSVYRLLNHCKTPMGARRFYYRLLHPSFNVAVIQREYDITEYILGLSDADTTKSKKYLNWRVALENVKDVEKLHRKIYLGKIYPKSLHILYTSLEIINEMYEGVKCDQTLLKYVNADACPERITEFCVKMKKEIDSHFIIEKCKNIDSLDFDLKYEDCFIQPGVSKELDATFIAHEDGFSIFEAIRAHCNDLIALGEKTAAGGKEKEFVKRHETEKLGLSIQTTDRRSKILLDQIAKRVKAKQCVSTLSYKSIDCAALKTFDFDLSLLQFVKAGNSTVTFIHEKIHSVCSSISQTRGKIRDEIGVVFGAFVGSLKEHQESFQTVISFVTDVDLMQNQAHVACTYKYCKPTISTNEKVQAHAKTQNKGSFVDARDIRHCLIEQINEDELYVCNDISLGLSERGMLLYGTNAVGKTSLIRAIGICIIMAQAGLYVPCSAFTYSPYTNIMTRILGNDNLFKGMSTFAVEMSELRVILKCADKNSLILGDELCSGTEIDSAISIFVAGLQKLHALKSCFIFATHMHEIVDYEEIAQMQDDGSGGVGGLVTKHMAVTYDRAHDVLIYDRKLRDGAGPSMYGLEVCKSLHLPDDFLKMANDIRLKYRNKKQTGDLNFKQSHFNAHKIKGICELCKQNLGEEVHHLQHQKEADEANFIQHFHKNHPANLMTVCESCHLKMHGTGDQQFRRVLTTGADGYILRGTQGSPRTPPFSTNYRYHGSETNFHEWANNM